MAQSPRRDRRGVGLLTLGIVGAVAAVGVVYYLAQTGGLWPSKKQEIKRKSVVVVLNEASPG
jgi:hypothetical protein